MEEQGRNNTFPIALCVIQPHIPPFGNAQCHHRSLLQDGTAPELQSETLTQSNPGLFWNAVAARTKAGIVPNEARYALMNVAAKKTRGNYGYKLLATVSSAYWMKTITINFSSHSLHDCVILPTTSGKDNTTTEDLISPLIG